MDEEKKKKIRLGREKLAVYKRKKSTKEKNTSDTSTSNSDNSLSLTLLPEKNVSAEQLSDSNSISEHILSSNDSLENDRSFQEIEINNVPELQAHTNDISDGTNSEPRFSLVLQNDDQDVNNISQENRPFSLNDNFSMLSINIEDKVRDEDNSSNNNVQSILDEIFNKKMVFSDSSLHSDDCSNSNLLSLNIFEGVNLDDKSITNYVTRLKSNEAYPKATGEDLEGIKHYEELLATKDVTINTLNAELDSLREIASNTSTNSLNTSTTEYKQLYEEYRHKIADFENAIAHRDKVIEQLAKSLEESALDKQELKKETEKLAQEVLLLQEQCTITTNYLKQQTITTQKVVDLDENQNSDATEQAAIDRNVSSENLHLDSSCTSKDIGLNEEFKPLELTLNANQLNLMKDLKLKIQLYVEEKVKECKASEEHKFKLLKEQLGNEKNDYDSELKRLQELSLKCESKDVGQLRQELEVKHAKEMEELRTYFEQKCTDMEKHYSEEVFSQQSRKMSGSSSISDAELTSDLVYGPGGDTAKNTNLEMSPFKASSTNEKKIKAIELRKSDVVQMMKELNDLNDYLQKYNMDKLNDNDLNTIKDDLAKYNLRNITKVHLNVFITETQNKYHAELEILREDYENKIDALNVDHEKKLENVERKYEEQIQGLRYELDEALKNAALSVSNAVQEVMLASSSIDDAEWPTELMTLRNKFSEKYEKIIAVMKETHEKQISELKEDYLRRLERAQRRSLKEDDEDNEPIRERNRLRKTTTALRNLLRELLVYFTDCEDELNNTLIDEIIKQNFERNNRDSNEETVLNDTPIITTKRVHLTPNFNDFLKIVDNTSFTSLDSSDLSVDLKNELGACLERLKSDANAVLALTAKETFDDDDDIDREQSIQSKCGNNTRSNVKDCAEGLEDGRALLENEIVRLLEKHAILELELRNAKEKIANLMECQRKEVVSEGFGESVSDKKRSTLMELQERAKNLVSESGTETTAFQLIDDLCREADLIVEEAKREKDDLILQIEAADKKLKSTCEFLELQANEREQERDEAQKAIETLKEQIRDREKDRVNCERINKEDGELLHINSCCYIFNKSVVSTVEILEQQMHDMTKLMKDNDARQQEIENERKEAIEKIYELREIIRDLESQVESKTEIETRLKNDVGQLESVVKQQTELNRELTDELSALKNAPDGRQCQEIIVRLEEELQRFKVSAEVTGNESVLQHIRIQLFDIESSIDGKTRDLEALHAAISSTACSSPTEDMSIKDQVRPYTPNTTLGDDCDVPLQQLARLKEKLIKHTRAEDAAVKRIHDLEMQLSAIKRDHEEVQSDKDMLQEKIAEQVELIASLQMRLDEQRLRADNVSKQTNTSLEIRIYDLENEVQNLTEKICNRDKTIKQLNNAIDETRKRLEEREVELIQMNDDKNFIGLENENERLRKEVELLKEKISVDVQNVQILPNLVDNIIADKNADLEKLRDEINSTRKELEFYTGLSFDKEQLRTLNQLKSSGRAFTELLTLLDETDRTRAEPFAHEQMVESPSDFNLIANMNQSSLKHYKSHSIDTVHADFENTPKLLKPQSNSTEIMKSSEKRVHFDDVEMLKEELQLKEEIIGEYNKRLHVLEEKYETLQNNLDMTEMALKEATITVEKEQNHFKEIEQNLRVELAEKKLHLSEYEKKLEMEKQDSIRKDQLCMDLTREKKDLDRRINELLESNRQVEEMKKELEELKQTKVDSNKLQEEIKMKTDEVESLKLMLNQIRTDLTEKASVINQLSDEMNAKSDELKTKDEENSKLMKELKNKQSQINLLGQEMEVLKGSVKEKEEEIQNISLQVQDEKQESLKDYEFRIKDLQNLLTDKQCEIEILNEDIIRYQNEIGKLELQKTTENNFKSNEIQLQLMKIKKEVATKDLEIVKLKSEVDDSAKEILHLREYLAQKDKIIEQIKADSNSLRINLETIQSKIQETGNIIDLRNRLQEQIEINSNLQSEMATLRHSQNEPRHSLDEIEGQVREQLNYSAHLDSSILSAINSGSEQEDTEYTRKLLNKQKALNARLKDVNMNLERQLQDFERRFQAEHVKVSQLEILLETEKRNSEAVQLEDANLIEQMRLHLEAAREGEKEFEKMIAEERKKFYQLLEDEKKIREDLEVRLQIAIKSGNSASSKSETEYKSLPNLLQMELEHVKRELQAVIEVNAKLKQEMKQLKQTKFDTETNCKYLNDMLKLKTDEIGSLEARINNDKQIERDLRDTLIKMSTELDQRNREVENSRALLEEFEEERNLMKQDIERLNDKIKALQGQKQNNSELFQEEVHMTSTIPDKFIRKMKELSQIVKDHVRNNRVMTDMLSKLNEERRVLQDKIAALESQNNLNMPFDDPVARANHLFAKYLRSESYRKALIFQKNYLIRLLVSYQTSRNNFSVTALQNPTKHARSAKLKGISRFRSVALVIISLSRMHYLVQRWHTGKRLTSGDAAVVTHSRRQQFTSNLPRHRAAATFQLGQPVSSQNFSIPPNVNGRTSIVLSRPLVADDPIYDNSQFNYVFNDVPNAEANRSAFNNHKASAVPSRAELLRPWSGESPPSKDRAFPGNSKDLPVTPTNTRFLRDDSPLSSPDLLNHYVERFNQIQNKLGIALENINSS